MRLRSRFRLVSVMDLSISTDRTSRDYRRIERAIRYLEDHFQEQPALDEIAAHLNLSPYHFQRLFRRWAGISPKRFLQFLTVDYAKRCLDASESVLDAAFDSGLSGPGRLHDLFVNLDAVTPGEYKSGGQDLRIEYGFHDTPFGRCLLAATPRGICWLSFPESEDVQDAIEALRNRWPEARLLERPESTASTLAEIFPEDPNAVRSLTLHVKGTNFQIKVWEALLRVPFGHMTTYRQIARSIGCPGAARAVGSAVGANPVACLIPCHRVIRNSGVLGQYRWGTARKKALLGHEAARLH